MKYGEFAIAACGLLLSCLGAAAWMVGSRGLHEDAVSQGEMALLRELMSRNHAEVTTRIDSLGNDVRAIREMVMEMKTK